MGSATSFCPSRTPKGQVALIPTYSVLGLKSRDYVISGDFCLRKSILAVQKVAVISSVLIKHIVCLVRGLRTLPGLPSCRHVRVLLYFARVARRLKHLAIDSRTVIY